MSKPDRLHALDAVRAFALLLGVVFHAGFSFIPGMIPGLWAIVDTSPSTTISVLLFTAHIFRMSLFFLIAGFFARMLFHRRGTRGFWLESRQAHPGAADRRLARAGAVDPAVWLWGLTRTFGGTLPAAPPSMPPPPPGAFPLTHLWFLYYLLMLYVTVVTGRALVVALDRSGIVRRAVDRTIAGLVRSGAAALVLSAAADRRARPADDWVDVVRHPDAGPVGDPAGRLARRLWHGAGLRLARAPADRSAGDVGQAVADASRRESRRDHRLSRHRWRRPDIRAGAAGRRDARLCRGLRRRHLVLELRGDRRGDAVPVG